MWGLDHKEGWLPKNWCFWSVVLEKTLESALGCKKIKPLNPKENQPWIFTDAETPILWPPDAKSWLTGKDPDTGKDWRQVEKGVTEDEMVGWHHGLSGRKSEQTGRWWRTGKPGVLQSMGLLRVGHDSATAIRRRHENQKHHWLLTRIQEQKKDSGNTGEI